MICILQVRNHLYTVKSFPDFTLDSRFARQAEEIADAIENNQTRQAEYLSEKMVLDYGTHVITSVDAGAVLVEEDYLKSTYISDSQSSSSSVSVSAGVNFFNKVNFNFGSKDSQQSSETTNYQNNITYSITMSHGGALFYQGITLQKWQESTLNNLVAIDRSGLPLHYFLNSATFPDLPLPTVNKVAMSVSQAIDRYYKINTIPGCVNQDSKNFNFQANVDDASCEGPNTNLSFGGVYQTCTPLSYDGGPICKELSVKNPASGSYSCQHPYTSTLLRTEVVERSYNSYECHNERYSCGFFHWSTCNKQVCGNVYRVRSATVQTYWCSTNMAAPEFSGYLFGGLFGPDLQNPLTKSRSCPSNFFALNFLSSGTMICLSNDYEQGTRFSVPFGGFFSCESKNPLARNQMRCPPKFSQHLLAISDGCQVLYCVQSGIFTGGELLPVKLPPFTRPPVISMLATNTVAVMTQGDKAWVRIKNTKMWKIANPEDIVKMSQAVDDDSSPSNGVTVGIVFGVLGLIVVVLPIIVIVLRKRRRTRGYERFHSNKPCEASVECQIEQQPDSQT